MNLLNFPPAGQEKQLIQVAKVMHHDFIIPIFMVLGEGKNPSQFYFHPLILLDPKSITVKNVNESNGFFKQDFVRFTVLMWDQELRSKVLERLRSLPSLKDEEIKEEDVHIMSYEEVQLIFKPDKNVRHESIKLMKQPTPYYPRLSETLDFYLLCDSSSTAHSLAEDLHQDPEFCLRNLQLVLECRGLVLFDSAVQSLTTDRAQSSRPIFFFNLFTLPSIDQPVDDIGSHKSPSIGQHSVKEKDLVKELETASSEMIKTNDTNPITVFKVSSCNFGGIGKAFTFTNGLGTKTEYGVYDFSTGIFTVKTAGVYQFKYDALQLANSVNHYTHIELRVDGVKAAEFLSQSPPEKKDYEPIALSSTLPLKEGQQVGVFLAGGRLYAASPTHTTQFSGVVFPDQEAS